MTNITIPRAEVQKALDLLERGDVLSEVQVSNILRAALSQAETAEPQSIENLLAESEANFVRQFGPLWAAKWVYANLRDALKVAPPEKGDTADPQPCWCQTCRPITLKDMRMVVCPDCGNKRCPKANDHRNACTGSNEPGQPGSAYPVAQQPQEPRKPLTEDQIYTMYSEPCSDAEMVEFAREVERHHGIGEADHG